MVPDEKMGAPRRNSREGSQSSHRSSADNPRGEASFLLAKRVAAVGALVAAFVVVVLIVIRALPEALPVASAAFLPCLIVFAAVVNARTASRSATAVDVSREDRLLDVQLAQLRSDIANADLRRAGLELERAERELERAELDSERGVDGTTRRTA